MSKTEHAVRVDDTLPNAEAEQIASPITNNFAQSMAQGRPPLPIERSWVYLPEAEWAYSHHPHLCAFNGSLYAMWSNGHHDEDAPNQRVLLAKSDNFVDWSEPTVLFDAGLPSDTPVAQGSVMTAGGFHQHEGELVAYAGCYEYASTSLSEGRRPVADTGHINTRLLARTCREASQWEPFQDLGLPFVPNHGPQATASGRLILSGGITFPYTDDPRGLSGWVTTGIVPGDSVVDDSGNFQPLQAKMGWAGMPCEGSFYQTDDGTLHMLLRTGTGQLWVTESGDDGHTWSPPAKTTFTDNSTKFHFGRLPDGRFYCVGNPDPKPEFHRCPLVLSLSRDGMVFDQAYTLAETHYTQRYDGLHKVGQYGYPHSLIHEGHLYVIFSRKKEAIELLRLPLNSLT